MIEILGTIAMILSVAGVLLNNRRMISCFYLWSISNAMCAYLHFDAGLYSLVLRDIIFLVLAADGIYRWRRKEGSK